MAVASVRRSRGGRLGGVLNLVVCAAVLLAVIPLALQAAQSPPPDIAEFAPSVQQHITQAPSEQGSQFGRGAQGSGQGGAAAATPTPPAAASGGPGAPGATPTPPPQRIPANELKRCVGSPPRQTEDPQSPPCVPYYDCSKGNGGATAPGVTKDTIYIVIPTEMERMNTQFSELETFFNNRFEFYCRTVKFEYCQSGTGASPESNQDSDAASAAGGCSSGQPVFASEHYRSDDGRYYSHAIGCSPYNKIVAGGYAPFSADYLAACGPSIWQYAMDADTEFASIGQWVCARLAGGTASHAQGNDNEVPARPLNSLPRKFGVFVAPYYADDTAVQHNPPAYDRLLQQLQACGITVAGKDVIVNPVASAPDAPGVTSDPSSANNAVLQMKQDNVTSVICLCNLFGFGALQKAALSQSYTPEWIASSYGTIDINAAYQLGANPPQELATTFGVTFQPRQVLPQSDPAMQAVKEANPGDPIASATTEVQNLEENYRPLLLIMSGIQMAGPDLTPQTFQAALQKTVFPNPDTPIHAGKVGFLDGNRGMTVDGAEWWYSTTAVGPFADSRQGTICYVDHGVRHDPGAWPRGGDPFFQGTCDSGANGP